MRKRLSRLAPTIIVGVTALLVGACGDAESASGPVAAATPTPRIIVITVTPTPPPTPAPTPELRQTPTGQTPSTSLQNRSATPLPTERVTPTAAPPSTPAPIATPAPTEPPRSVNRTPTAIVPPPNARASVGRVATAEGVDGLQRPVNETTTFDPMQRVYITVEFINVRTGAELGFSWRADEGCAGSFTLAPQTAVRRGFFAFYIDETECLGRYVVQIMVDGAAHAETTFAIGAAQPIG